MKNTAVIIILVMLAGTGFSQVPGFSIGPRAGYNSSTLTTDVDSIRADTKGAFQFGAFMRIGQRVYVQPEVNYVVKGGMLNGDFSMGKIQQEVTLRSITIPFLIGIRLLHSGNSNFRVMAGPVFSYISGKELKPVDMIGYWPIKTTDDFKESTWSAQMGAGFDIWRFTLDVRYELGVDNIYTGSDDLKLRNNLFNVSLGFKFL
jgi:hypothetical protein